MAKKKTGKKKTYKKRRVSGLGGIDFMTPVKVSAGAALGTYAINGPFKTTSSINYIAIAAGLVVAKFMPKFAAVGAGVTAAGVVSLLQNNNFISGVGRVMIHGGPPGSGPISSLSGMGRRRMGAIPPKAAAAMAVRNSAAGNGRVIIGRLIRLYRPYRAVATTDLVQSGSDKVMGAVC